MVEGSAKMDFERLPEESCDLVAVIAKRTASPRAKHEAPVSMPLRNGQHFQDALSPPPEPVPLQFEG